MTSCTRKGYCNAGCCTYREGDYTPKEGVRPEIFAKTAIVPAISPCADGCCANSAQVCANRNEVVQLPPRHGDLAVEWKLRLDQIKLAFVAPDL
ncbi:Aste57867_6526 [Aphanomyces stellatus]|uniref:Aste57867_6526 protein n=1 Tax=Aphanomyces stellatus TaxID=120398 RepID=A0A485KFV6_9STRA|nr:hypothetical protein As57867_006509 [Aphanomyces stellatus]VFT83508.1 Aste57867_6526 [Aphanomyces stellatus]